MFPILVNPNECLIQWIGGPMQLVFGIIAVARWISIPHYIETLNPTWMIPCVGNLVVAFAAPIVDTSYTSVGWLWYGFGIVTFVPLFALTIYRVTFKEFLGMSSFRSASPLF